MVDTITLPAVCDYHCHFREGPMMERVVGMVPGTGVRRCYVMPNLTPPLVEVDRVVKYREELQAAAGPDVEFLMTLYLHPRLTPADIDAAKSQGIVGVKSYPRGVTTNSDSGIESYDIYYPIFRAMERNNMVLNLHGEVPSDHHNDVCVLNAEIKFLKHLDKLHEDFPNLRIVLEHTTTSAAIEKVKELGPTVAATITVHHLELCVDDWAGKNHNFCKPVAKYPSDRQALIEAVKSGNPKFFLGSDSAPHPKHMKENACGCAGVFTTPYILPYLASTFEKHDMLDRLEDFACHYGDAFYQRKPNLGKVKLRRTPCVVADDFRYANECVVPFKAGEELPWSICSVEK